MPEVRLIDADGQQAGVVPLEEAIQMAEASELDLVEIAANAVPPVCRILDYGKYKYEEEKKERAARKHHHTSELKELRIRPRTDDHDLQVRARAARKFIQEGHKVRLLLRFRGRESSHPEVARAQIYSIAESLADIAVLETLPQMQGQSMYAILARGRARDAVPAKPAPGATAPVAAPQPPAKPSPVPANAAAPAPAPQPPAQPSPAPEDAAATAPVPAPKPRAKPSPAPASATAPAQPPAKPAPAAENATTPAPEKATAPAPKPPAKLSPAPANAPAPAPAPAPKPRAATVAAPRKAPASKPPAKLAPKKKAASSAGTAS